MRAWRIATVAALAVALSTLAALTVQSQDRPEQRQQTYKVISWPTSSTERPYREDVERLLNEMATRGWKLHGDLAAQGARMLVFERASGG